MLDVVVYREFNTGNVLFRFSSHDHRSGHGFQSEEPIETEQPSRLTQHSETQSDRM